MMLSLLEQKRGRMNDSHHETRLELLLLFMLRILAANNIDSLFVPPNHPAALTDTFDR